MYRTQTNLMPCEAANCTYHTRHVGSHKTCTGQQLQLALPGCDLLLPNEFHPELSVAGSADVGVLSICSSGLTLCKLVCVSEYEGLHEGGAWADLGDAHKRGSSSNTAAEVSLAANLSIVLASACIIPLNPSPRPLMPLN
jgi:hypothetical protein